MNIIDKNVVYELDDDNMYDDDDDDDDEDQTIESLNNVRDPPIGYYRFRPSQYNNILPTIFIEYPVDLNKLRKDVSFLEPVQNRKLNYRCYWERHCLKGSFVRNAFHKSEKNWTLSWSKHLSNDEIKQLNCLQKASHFPSSWCVGRKDRLSRTINSMKRLYPDEYSFHPESFVLPVEQDLLSRNINNNGGVNNPSLWIMKPCASRYCKLLIILKYCI